MKSLTLYFSGGEQPETLAWPKPGALRGDTPLSRAERKR